MEALNLAIECSGAGGSVALSTEASLVGFRELVGEQNSVQSLAPAIEGLLAEHMGDFPSSKPPVEFITVTVGPGSFTGLRVGVATAKMLAYGWGVPVVGTDSLHALAWQAAVELAAEIQSPAADGALPEAAILIPVLNAYRKQVFTSAWLCEFAKAKGSHPTLLCSSQVVSAASWQADPVQALGLDSAQLPLAFRPQSGSNQRLASRLESGQTESCGAGLTAGSAPGEDVSVDHTSASSGLVFESAEAAKVKPLVAFVFGAGLEVYPPRGAVEFGPELKSTASLVMLEHRYWGLSAVAVAELGWSSFRAGLAVPAAELRPNYVRASAAEEKANQRAKP